MPSEFTSAPSPGSASLLRLTPALVVVGVAVAWSASLAGFPTAHWYPGAIAVVLVLAAGLAGIRPRLGALSRPVQVALGSLALYTAWSYLSITWADSQGVAWDGANRTLLYLAVFAVMTVIPLDGSAGLAVVSAWTLALIALATWVLLALPDPIGAGPVVQGPGLSAPTGYTNGQACLWLMAAWPALYLSARPAVHPALRAVFAGGVVICVDAALLSESRGSLVAGAITLVLLVTILPGRVRSLLALALCGAGVAATTPHVLDIANALENDPSAIPRLGTIAGPVLAAAAAVALVAGVAAAFEGRRPLAPRTVRVGRRVVAGVAVGLALAGVAAALVAAGDPVDRVNREWHSFKQGTTSVTPGTTALSKGFGGARYDFYRVSLDLVREHPLLGLGADNFSQQYLARGRALEGPSYVHSLELRALVHTGVVGALLLAIAFGSALAAAWRGMRAGPRAGAAAAAGTIVFVHWFVQGSADFFWELPALGATAFAMLGVACAMSPQRVRGDGPARRNGALRLVWPLGAVVGLAAVASLALPWMATIEVSRASRVWPVAPDAALRQLHVASQLNPLSAQPALNEGTIAVRIGRPARAARAFTEALRRDPRDHYATLMLGALASARGDRRAALRLLRRAAALNPQDSATTGALAAVRAHRKADPVAVIAQLRTTVRMLLR